MDLSAEEKIIQRLPIKDKNGKMIEPTKEELYAKKQKEQIVYTGFVAQEVEKAAKSLNYNFSGVDVPKNDKDLYGLRYSEFVVPLAKAVQELSIQNDSLQTTNKFLQSQIDKLIQRMNALETAQQKYNNTLSQQVFENSESLTVDKKATMEQNSPNPFINSTVIRYRLPANVSKAQIIITDMNAHVLKSMFLNAKGSGQVTITAGTLSAGNYIYYLVVDGKKVDSKQMILTK